MADFKSILIKAQRESDSTAQPVILDESTQVLPGMSSIHHEVHEGNHFFYNDVMTLDDTNVQDYLLTAPNTTKWIHLFGYVDGLNITQFELYEATDKTGTTLQTTFNSNRNSVNTAGLTIHKGTSGGTTDGTLLKIYSSGSATNKSQSGSSNRDENELILKQNTKYILRLTSGADGNLTNIKLTWYEHTNKI